MGIILENTKKTDELWNYFYSAYSFIEYTEEKTGEENTEAVSYLSKAGVNLSAWLKFGDEEYYKSCVILCENAIFTTIKNGILFYCKHIKSYRKKYNSDDLTKFVRDYSDKIKKVGEANRNIISYEKQSGNLEMCINSFYDVINFYEELITYKYELKILKNRNRNNAIIAISVAISAVATAIIMLIQLLK